ncbi:MAG: hypothetical protein FWG47_03670 [Propionibacteriaceae bacterium]|nr:hypothetical protein [Propionibacteriaceae bacterium]
MCYPRKCEICGKTTWGGCGAHVAQVKVGVPAENWCDGKHTQAEIDNPVPQSGFLSRFFGR